MSTVVWLTGVPASGKTTLAYAIQHKLSHPCIILDSDVVRKSLWPSIGLSDKERNEHVFRTGILAALIAGQLEDCVVIVACIAPFSKSRDLAINTIKQIADCHLVHLHAPLIDRIERDPKGLYSKALFGEIEDLTGYDGTYEQPVLADLTINTGKISAKDAADIIIDLLIG